jgi:hypothetical protein
MILGRNTVQWMAAITVTIQFLKQTIPVLFPGVDREVANTVLDGLTALIGAWILFLAGTSTTPTNDPQLKAGTMVRVTDESGTVVGHTPVPEPEKP